MEGRLALTISSDELEKNTGFKMNPNDIKKHFSEPQYNWAPSCFVPVLTNLQSDKIRFLRWGLIPSWSNSSKNTKGLASISLKSFKDKPVLQKAIQNKRCITFANGFFLWKDSPAGKIPYFVRLRSKAVFGIAGLWESWEEEENAINTSCIITKKPEGSLAYFPSEIPLVVKWDEQTKWLATEKSDILTENYFVPEAEFEYYPVSRKIIKSLENDPKFIQMISYLVAEQTKLF
jgi:putative SOS response-associated peptidase YedK